MVECFRCGIDNEKALLYDAITPGGVEKICRRCSHKESVPLMKNKDLEELKEFERKHDIYDRISRVAGIENKRKLNNVSLEIEEQDSTLRDLVEKNVCNGVNKSAKNRVDLIKNFHWLIKRYRRMKKLTTKQFAEEIGEVEKSIILAEQGVVPTGYDLIRKIELFLNIRLIKPEIVEEMQQKARPVVLDNAGVEEVLDVNSVGSQNLTIADLQEMKNKREALVVNEGARENEPEFVWDETEDLEQESKLVEGVNDKFEGKTENPSGKAILSQEEIDDLVFGRK